MEYERNGRGFDRGDLWETMGALMHPFVPRLVTRGRSISITPRQHRGAIHPYYPFLRLFWLHCNVNSKQLHNFNGRRIDEW